ncbi:MAG: hypothetical protein K0S01_1609 [Herbinix sp.]|jgi:ABC-2 type transport system permease protein|nr:hypothetical protein [Herbinix sp.]
MNIYLYELKSLRKSAILWICAMIALAALYFSIYPSMSSDALEFKELLSNYPPTVRAMLGIDLDYITSILGFYSMIFGFIILCGAIQAMNLGVSILSKESRERTADFLLVKPVSRQFIITAKLMASFTTIVVTDIIFCLASFAIANRVKTVDFSNKVLFMINLTLFFIQLIFLAVGVVVSVFFNKIKSVLPLSLGIVFGLYMIGALLATGEDAETLRFLSPFKYFNITYIIKNSSYEVSYLILSMIIVVVSVIATYIIYSRKDIHAVS